MLIRELRAIKMQIYQIKLLIISILNLNNHCRFLTMVAHLVITITLLLSRDENVRACLPLDHTKLDFARKDVELATGLGAAIGLLIIEFMGFFSGLSMFGAPSISLTSIIAHSTATVALGKDFLIFL